MKHKLQRNKRKEGIVNVEAEWANMKRKRKELTKMVCAMKKVGRLRKGTDW